jgi:anti-sigma B factor antagonist
VLDVSNIPGMRYNAFLSIHQLFIAFWPADFRLPMYNAVVPRPKEEIVNFSAAIRRRGEVSIVDLSGQLTSFASGVLRQTVGDLIQQGKKQIVLNVGNLLYLDSSGVGALVNCYMSVIKQGGEMKVVGLTPKVEEVLKITQLYRIFQEFQNEEEALQSFPPAKKRSAGAA